MESSAYVTSESTCSLTYSRMPTDINIGDCILLQKKPCKVSNIAVCKTGKHGSAKYHFTGKDIFTQKKYEEMFMCHETVQVPNVTKTLMHLLLIEDDGHLQLMSDADASVRYDLVLPSDENLCNKIKKMMIDSENDDTNSKDCCVVVQSAMGFDAIIDCKVR